MRICQRCGWLVPWDCTCPSTREGANAKALVVEQRHRAAVARARASDAAKELALTQLGEIDLAERSRVA